jgi:hypothetical protein
MSIIDIGDNHKIKFIGYEDDPCVGINVIHKAPDGKDCAGWVPFKGRAWEKVFSETIQSWDILSMEPLTLTPSILCTVCGDHGFIRNGKWEKA